MGEITDDFFSSSVVRLNDCFALVRIKANTFLYNVTYRIVYVILLITYFNTRLTVFVRTKKQIECLSTATMFITPLFSRFSWRAPLHFNVTMSRSYISWWQCNNQKYSSEKNTKVVVIIITVMCLEWLIVTVKQNI